MNNWDLHIEQLIVEKISGTINEEDSSYLDGLIETDAKIKEKWEKIKKKFQSLESQRFLQGIDAENGWLKFEKGIRRKKLGRTILIRRLTIAASFMIPLCIAAIFFFHSKTSNSIALVPNSDRNVKLYVNGTGLIDLSNYTSLSGIDTLNNVKLTINKGSLSYVASNNQASGTLNTLVIPETQTYKLTLSDGSEVWLNSLSQLKFPFIFSKDKREVWINGEAYFKVAKNRLWPFIVHTSLTDIQVLGTEFNVNTYDSLQIKTALVNGSINTRAANGRSILLKPGFQSVFSKTKEFKVAAFDSESELSWMKGVYFFQNSSLNDIAHIVYRWYGITLIFDNDKISSSRFTGALIKEKTLKEFLDNLVLTSNINISYRSDNGAIRLSER